MIESSRVYQDVSLITNKRPKKKKPKKLLLFLVVVLLVGVSGVLFLKAGFTVSRITQIDNNQDDDIDNVPKKELPKDDPDILNILLMGMRGAQEAGEGQTLTDAMVLLSLQQSTGKVALVSIPRDLFVDIYCLKEVR